MTDEELVSLFQSGDKAAGEQLLAKYKNAVLMSARRFFLSGGETEDLVQEGMCGLYSAMVTYDVNQNSTFATYAQSCIKNRILDAVKSNNNYKNYALNGCLPIIDIDEKLCDYGENPEDKLINNETEKEFLSVLRNNLSPFEYKVMTMYIDGNTMAEISLSLERSFKSIDNAITRARKKLQKIFNDNKLN
jgi:RNA polymerase sporulation-specific sigma factor